ncbi:F-box/LRR-repeat protein 6 [Sphaerodactylus townsendi]|uniref:F-box/LRR-repeat protein 6 n=1 Tax=Sphaerodactylus townsendi TaxID=933632 RepID=UPI002026A7E2|nr:F-box/LRR-repeat protein 6 [Sphaerodactylus townsendi]XP_048338531.1 F-box/LRR-repeat protein 6 [Sphaerodactylus townsendi]XP_048338532.1 F-box/LRR-repeat protein 6 [Sphaerodactylus townsendi]XP_048338533.1 F-box/LRR-repeat protein 6 [Sphaerodactylus townsendi]
MEERPPSAGLAAEASPAAKTPAPKKKPRKAPRRVTPDFFVHETDDDMLLIISNVGEEQERPTRKVSKRKPEKAQRRKGLKRAASSRGKGGALANQPLPSGGLGEGSKTFPSSAPPAAASSWGEQLPAEVLVQIFQQIVASEGSVPFLCRVARVCRLWYGAAADPVLWQKVSLGYCWAAPGQKWSPAVERRALGTVEWLAGHRFSRLRDFALCHWKQHVPFVLKEIGRCCPLLASLKLSHCSGVTAESLAALAARCPRLESLNVQNSQVPSSAVVSFLEAAGSRIRHLWLTYSTQTSPVIAALSNGSCPGLRLLEVNTEIKQSSQHFQLSIEQLQASCPHLQVLRLLNVVWSPKPVPRSAPHLQGFPELTELCLATTSNSFVDDSTLGRILWASERIRMLDLRGCFRVTPRGLQLLPCPDLEQLYLGLYGSSSPAHLPLEGSPLLTCKWSHSLQELDLAGQRFREQDLEQAMTALAQGQSPKGGPPLRSLNLTGTKVMLSTVSTLITSCPALTYLNLSSCRHLPRGTKKAYRGQEEIRQCLHHLLTSAEEHL